MRNSLKSLVVAAAVFAVASAAQAGIIHYPNQVSGGLTVSNITETNNTPTDSYYGPATLSGTLLSFQITGGTLPFAASSSGAGDSDLIDVKLSFDVTSTSPLPVAALLSEEGDFFTGGTGTGGDGASLLLFSTGDSLIVGNTDTFNVPAGTASGVWSNSVSDTSNAVANSFHVVIDNILHTASLSPSDFALIEKKGLTINLGSGAGGGGAPEPASLGVLSLGALALIGRRRKA